MIHLLAVDTVDLTKLVPEVALVLILLWFFDRKDARQEARDKEHAEAMKKLGESIDKNTEITSASMTLTKETITYLKHRNGSFEKLIQDAPALHDLLKRVDKAK